VTMATRLPVIMRDSNASGRLPDDADALQRRLFRPLHRALLERDDRERAKCLEELPRPQQEVGVRRSSVALVAGHEGFVDQHPAFVEALDEAREERPVEIICNHDRGETLSRPRPGTAVFQVGSDEADRAREAPARRGPPRAPRSRARRRPSRGAPRRTPRRAPARARPAAPSASPSPTASQPIFAPCSSNSSFRTDLWQRSSRSQ
jgi:hypothetical protein